MKKLILIAIIANLLAVPAFAACNGGTMYNGFCISNNTLNWWSASNWCQANGMHLATIYEACPDWDGNTGSGKCGRTITSEVSSYVWTATASGSDNAFFVIPSDGHVSNVPRHNTIRALCAS